MTIIPHDAIMSPNYCKNSDRSNDLGYADICCICGKGITDENCKELHWFDGGDLLTDFSESFPEELKERDSRFGDPGDLGFHHIGADCYRKWLKMKKSGKYDEEV